MSKKNDFDINYVAQLARLELTDEEKEHFAQQLSSALEHFDALSKVDVEGVEPMAHAFPLSNVWDEDIAGETFSVEEVLSNASKVRENQIVVPKVVE
jgi:aspartyl-tRNA(Asn)/glutamyl-tRNA(Gln) amidotransferase subunit C